MQKHLVGGAVRDICKERDLRTHDEVVEFLATTLPGPYFAQVHDLDWVVEVTSFDDLRRHLLEEGCKIHTEKPECVTIRVGLPKHHWMRQQYGVKDADFVAARADGPSTDGRRPDYVQIGSFLQDRARRDFTVNAMAMNLETGEFFDDHGGLEDLANMQLKFVGDPYERIEEDGLRVLRAFRFMICKDLSPSETTWRALRSDKAAEMLARRSVSVERIREELLRMFAHDSLKSLELLAQLPDNTKLAIFRDGLWLTPTLEKR